MTEWRQMEEHLRERSEQLDAIFALSPDGFVSFDSRRRVKYVSPAFLGMTGAIEEDLVGRDEQEFSAWLAGLSSEHARFPGIATLRARSRASGDGRNDFSSRRQIIELSGPGKRVLEYAFRESLTGAVPQILYFRDVTHEVEIDRLKSEFLSTAAHELRTPMASIYGFSELMLDQEFTAEERHEFVSAIHRQSELMVSIINELLDLARIEARRGKDFKFAREEVADLVTDFLKAFKAPSGRPAPQLSLPDVPCWIRADRKKLAQALGNVVSNAYKYSPAGKNVSISVHGAESASESMVGLSVRDEGIGMTQAAVARVGERFFRADTSGKYPGTGLGMAIVKEIVDLHGGRLAVDSRPGTGTTVTLWFPADEPAAKQS
jgi:signal transduction histidine kinase